VAAGGGAGVITGSGSVFVGFVFVALLDGFGFGRGFSEDVVADRLDVFDFEVGTNFTDTGFGYSES